MKMFRKYLKYKLGTIIVYGSFFVLLLFSFYIFNLPVVAVAYPMGLLFLVGVAIFITDYNKIRRKYCILKEESEGGIEKTEKFPKPTSLIEEAYLDIIEKQLEDKKIAEENSTKKYNDMTNYYTVWAHQIKTPIASMQISLQNEDTALSRKLRAELGRIESYVKMVLTYIRLESDGSDYSFREYSLDELIKPVIKRFAGDFIGKQLRLNYQELGKKIITDEKWFGFVIEQVLSNAIKYTASGEISIYLEKESVLVIEDSGIGIAPEDLPRVFENGYTGFNGRIDKKASGIGLYLVKRVCDNLGCSISIESELDIGTKVKIDTTQKKSFYE